ncbi:MAG: DNA polymerase III subunit alpha [Fibrobacterota bacterium]
MSFKPFVHLHNHTDCSFLDGAIKIKALVARAKEFGMPAVAITDHGSLFGLIEFYREATKAGIKPILGYEAYVAVDSRLNRQYSQSDRKYDHLLLLARNEEGYRNLIRLATLAYTEGMYYKPRIDKELLRKYGHGLIGLSACIQGEIPNALIKGNEGKARAALTEYQAIFGKEHFYLELQDHGIDEELIANEKLIQLARELHVPLAATNDSHYLRREDSEAHDALLCIQTGKLIRDVERMRFTSDQMYFKSYEEMREKFSATPDALENTVKIAEACNVNLGLDSGYHWPQAPRAEGFADDDDCLAHLSYEGMKKRFPGADAKTMKMLREKVDFELSVMKQMKVAGYMLIVADFIQAARGMDIPVGPGRGSCVGSLVSYCVGITDVDPLKHNLLFERFLNPERVSMPDIDTDFSDRDRNRVIQYVVDKYGKQSVCQIATLGSMNAKAVLRDVARVLDIPLSEAGRIAKMVTDGPGVKLADEIKNAELKAALDESELYRKWIRIALTLEGLKRQPGVHAAGVIIAPRDVVNYSPLFTAKENSMLVTQYDKNNVESVGLLKMDFLGLRNLTVIQEAVKQVQKNHGMALDMLALPMDDAKTYALFARGDTVGVFQFESQGMQEYLRKLKPTNIEDIIAMNALYRPGPMENIPSYIHRKHGKEPIETYHKDLEPVLKDTNGIIVYQEQVMQIAQIIGGFSLGKADIMRRAMGKKKREEMDKLKNEFMAGAKAKKYPEALSDKIFELLAKFAEYGFNKSHAAAYSYVAFQTAYLKAHYTAEFMAANMTSELDDTDRVVILMAECKRLGISVLPPDINQSFVDFRATAESIMFGLGAIKGVGVGAVEHLIRERDKAGPFKTLFDLCKRIDMHVVNKRVLEALIHSGSMDPLKGNRAQLSAALETAMAYGATFQKDRESGQTSLFGGGGDDTAPALALNEPELPDVEPLPYADVLKFEKETLGFYVSGHPLKDYEDELNGFVTFRHNPEEVKRRPQGEKVVVGGIILSVRRTTDKKGKLMGFLQLETFEGPLEVIVFSSVYEAVAELIREDSVVLISGSLDKTNETNPKIISERIMPVLEARERLTKSVHVRLKTVALEEEDLNQIKAVCEKFTGPCSFILHMINEAGSEFLVRSGKLRVAHSAEFLLRLRDLAGKENVWLGRDY